MSYHGIVGKVHWMHEEMDIEWAIQQFWTLSDKAGDFYESSVFAFSDSLWCLRIDINGQNKESETYIGLFLCGKEVPIERRIRYSFSLKNVMGNVETKAEGFYNFHKNIGCGRAKYYLRSELEKQKSELVPGDVLTVCCSLKDISGQRLHKISLMERLLNVSCNMMKILKGQQGTDIVLKVDGEDIKAHKIILKTRSEVFEKMLSHDMLENRTGAIRIEDIEADVFRQVLDYMYSGCAEVTPENARRLYVAADRYNLQELTTLCATFMEANMSDDLFCDAFVIADTYNETELKDVVKEYLMKNSARIIETEKWKEFVSENHSMALQVLTMCVKENASKCADNKNA